MGDVIIMKRCVLGVLLIVSGLLGCSAADDITGVGDSGADDGGSTSQTTYHYVNRSGVTLQQFSTYYYDAAAPEGERIKDMVQHGNLYNNQATGRRRTGRPAIRAAFYLGTTLYLIVDNLNIVAGIDNRFVITGETVVYSGRSRRSVFVPGGGALRISGLAKQ